MDGPEHLRAGVQAFARSFGLLEAERTPCGLPLSTSRAHALMVLADSPSPPTKAELGRTLGLDKSNVTRLCQRMVEAGELELTPCPTDRRAQRLIITDPGRRRAAGVSATSRRRFEALYARLPADRRASVLEALALLHEAARALEAT